MNERRRYRVSVATFLVFLALLLLTIVDIRRGFLFSGYFKVGTPSALLFLDWRHLWLLLIAGLGLWLTYRYMAHLETNPLNTTTNLKITANIMALLIGILLVIDLFIYRGVPASRFIVAGKMTVGSGTMGLAQAIPVVNLPVWLQPIGEGVNYMLLVWHATTIGMLLGSLFLVAGTNLVTRLKGKAFSAHLTGTALALTQPFCSCCAAPVGSALYRKGASLGPVLAFTVSSPMLNITSLILASAILPVKFALLRIAGGIIIGVFVTYGVSLLAANWVTEEGGEARQGRLLGWAPKILNSYNRLFCLENFFTEESVYSPITLISNWLGIAWRLTRAVVPVLLVGSIMAVYLVRAMPDSGNSVSGVLVTSLFATLVMVPTWTEIPLAAQLINNGLTGTAAVMLIALPAVSIPCLIIISGAIRSFKVAITLGLAVFIAGILAGILFI